MASATWDEQNNCIQQKEGNLLGQALKDLDIYDLCPKQEAKPTATVLVDTMGQLSRRTRSINPHPTTQVSPPTACGTYNNRTTTVSQTRYNHKI